jgi:NADPH-dependent ferric siderophore reductase
MTTSLSAPRVQRLRHEIVRRELAVARVQTLGPNVRSITLAGDALEGFVSASFDDHVKLLLEADGQSVRRDYTPRHHDAAARELTLEFDLHSNGPAARWAAAAQPGQRVAIAGPRGSFVIAADHDWHLLAGDETALPAIARRLEELPAGTSAIVVLQVADAADRRELRSAARLQLQWVDDSPALIAAVRALALPPGAGYAWCAGEASAMAALRRVLVEEKGHDRHAIRAAAYWKRGAAAHHEHLED